METYGGGLWHTWFDRDLGLAGRIIEADSDGSLKERLVLLNKPILRIPTLAIHLDRSVKEGFKLNPETHLQPLFALEPTEEGKQAPATQSHHALLLEALGTTDEKLVSTELCLFDVQPPSLGGANGEFITSARLDNLCSTFCALDALASSDPINPNAINIVMMFDNEEVGSQSTAGADSSMAQSVIHRILRAISPQSPEDFASLESALFSRSLLLSVDMAHAVHPNYPEAHDELHRPVMGKGVVIKYNSNNRYATSVRSAASVKSLCTKHRIAFQEFMVRNDSPCGSTIGPMLASDLGIPCADIGVPQLSMHSIREVCGVQDMEHMIRLVKAFFGSSSAVVIAMINA